MTTTEVRTDYDCPPWCERTDHHADDPSNGHAVRVMRRAQGLTLRQLAERSGTSHSYLSQVERGDKVASPEWLRAVLDALTDNLSTARA